MCTPLRFPNIVGALFYKNGILYYNNGASSIALASAGDLENIVDELNARIDEVEETLNAKIDDVDARLTEEIHNVELSLERQIRCVEQRLNNKIDYMGIILNDKIDYVEESLRLEMEEMEEALNNKIDDVEANLNNRIDIAVAILNGRIDETNAALTALEAYVIAQIEATNLAIAKLSFSIPIPFTVFLYRHPLIRNYIYDWRPYMFQLVGYRIAADTITGSQVVVPTNTGPDEINVNVWGVNWKVYPFQFIKSTTSIDFTIVQESVPITDVFTLEVGYLQNQSTLVSDFNTLITPATTITELTANKSTFDQLHQETGKIQLPFAQGTLVTDLPVGPSTHIRNEYFEESNTDVDTHIATIVRTAISFIPVVGSIIAAGVTVIEAAINIGLELTNANDANIAFPDNFRGIPVDASTVAWPYTSENTFPRNVWGVEYGYVTKSVTERKYRWSQTNPGPDILQPPPDPFAGALKTIDWNLFRSATTRTPRREGPWVLHEEALSLGPALSLNVANDITREVKLFLQSHMYVDWPTTDIPGTSGLLAIGARQVKRSALPDFNILNGFPLRVRGQWSPFLRYVAGDVAGYLGQSYLRIKSLPESAPFGDINDTTLWEPLVDMVPLSKTESEYKYAQYIITATIDRNILGLQGQVIDPNWNAIYINGQLYGVFDGLTWVFGDNLLNP